MNANGCLSQAGNDRLGHRADRDPTGQYQISTWAPTKTFADYTALKTLPPVELEVTARSRRSDGESSTAVTLRNSTRALAFAIHLKINRAPLGRVSPWDGAGDDEVLPVLWQDKYFPLLPGETREVRATYNTTDLHGVPPVVAVEGWNVKTRLLSP